MALRIRSVFPLLVLLVPAAGIVLAAGTAQAATPTYYADPVMFQSTITSTVTDDYSNPGYVFNQSNAVMSAVLGETDYMSTGFANLNLVTGGGHYCAGCNGSFLLSFQTTSVGNAAGVNGVGLTVAAHDLGSQYYAFITFADGTTNDIALPAAGTFWGVAAPERIESIHIGLSMGGSTTGGYFEMDNLIVGDGNVGGCMVDGDCFDNGDVCTDPFCDMGMCSFIPNVAPCDDGNMCTEMDTCSMGVCGGTPVDCDDGNVCTTNLCEPGSGCVLQVNTEPCDDGSVCTEMDVCSGGVCGGTPIDCDDADVCSMDSCDPVMGCVNEPEVGCCVFDEDCGEEEMCDLSANVCVPVSSGSSDTGMADTGDTGTPSDTTSETSADVTGNGGTGVGDTNGDSGDTGQPATTSGGSETGTTAGEVPTDDPAGCGCTSEPSPVRGGWWMMGAVVMLLRRRRHATRAGAR